MATTTPSPPPASPHDEVEDDNQQPAVPYSPPRTSVPSPPLPIEEVDHHQQFANSNSAYSPPQTSVGQPENPVDDEQYPPPEEGEDQQEPPVSPLPPPEDGEDQQEPPVSASPPPEDKILDRQQLLAPPSPSSVQPASPPPVGVENPSENLSPNHESPISKQPPSPSPSPSLSQSPPTGLDDPVESPNYRKNPDPNSDHESPSPSSPTSLDGKPNPKPHQSPENPSPSPPPTAASPSSPPPPLGVPLLLQTAATSSPSRPQTSPWTNQETANLIQAYQEKWYSLKKGPLKAGQWEEVAITVAARCGYDEPTKTAKQCRHKIEKLRKRYRSERGKPRSKATAWNFFKLMDNLEKGPLPISSSPPLAMVEYQKQSNPNSKKRKNDESDGEFHVNMRNTRSTSSNHRISNGGLTRNLRFSDGGNERFTRGLRTPVVHKRKGFYQENEVDEEEEQEQNEAEDEDEGEDVGKLVAAEIKSFADKFVKMEKKKIEMMRDVERYRVEMEKKRTEMILESQQMLVESVNNAFRSSNKTHKLSAN